MATFVSLQDLIGEPEKITEFSFDEQGEILNDRTKNRVFLNSSILTEKNIKIDLTKNFESYVHKVDEYKKKFRSNMLLDFHRHNEGKMKETLMNADFFITRGTVSDIAGVNREDAVVFWAFMINGVIIVVKDDENIYNNNLLSSYIGLNFENIITSKSGDGEINYDKSVNNWEQYKEIYMTSVYLSCGENIKIAYSCEIDAFDKNTMMPLEIKTQFGSNSNYNNRKIFGFYKSISVSFQCLLGNIHEVVVGYKTNCNVVYSVKKYPVEHILHHSVMNVVRKCCSRLGNNLDKIKKLLASKNNKGFFKIKMLPPHDDIITDYFSETVPEIKAFFTKEFCDTFFYD
uniref:Decapping nuclease n=1 Tax=Strongyloides stercoralis TaxID=6248 RepID=A0A0K0DY81_STRER